MKLAGTTVLRVSAVLLAGALYYWLAHVFTSADRPSTAGALLSIAPYMAIALVMAWRSTRRALPVMLWIAVAALLAVNWSLLRSNFSWIYLMQHAGSFALLAIGFGRSLVTPEVPMISRFAARVHGTLPPRLAAYTRAVTQAWTIFFITMLSFSLLLFFAAPIAAWSWFANLLTPLLTGLLFAGEYLVRRRCLPRELRTGFVASIRAIFAAGAASASAGETMQPSTR